VLDARQTELRWLIKCTKAQLHSPKQSPY
jgi:hypothetical protein